MEKYKQNDDTDVIDGISTLHYENHTVGRTHKFYNIGDIISKMHSHFKYSNFKGFLYIGYYRGGRCEIKGLSIALDFDKSNDSNTA